MVRSAGRTRAWAAFYSRYGPTADQWLFHTSRGRAATRIGLPILLLTTTGARSGLPRVRPLAYVRAGADFIVVGTNFGQRHHPGWTANLLAHSGASIEVGPEELPVTSEPTDQATWERLWPRFVALYPGHEDYLARISSVGSMNALRLTRRLACSTRRSSVSNSRSPRLAWSRLTVRRASMVPASKPTGSPGSLIGKRERGPDQHMTVGRENDGLVLRDRRLR